MTKRTGDFSVVTNLLLVLLSLPISLWAQSEGNNVIYSGAAQAGSTAYIDATPYFNTSTQSPGLAVASAHWDIIAENYSIPRYPWHLSLFASPTQHKIPESNR